MCIILCLFNALNCRVGALQVSMIIMITHGDGDAGRGRQVVCDMTKFSLQLQFQKADFRDTCGTGRLSKRISCKL